MAYKLTQQDTNAFSFNSLKIVSSHNYNQQLGNLGCGRSQPLNSPDPFYLPYGRTFLLKYYFRSIKQLHLSLNSRQSLAIDNYRVKEIQGHVIYVIYLSKVMNFPMKQRRAKVIAFDEKSYL
jgi:hypothetical protein